MSRKNIEDAYPLSAVQEGMLFHSVYEPDSGVYVAQIACALRGLDVAHLKEAWRRVIERHAVLRTAFVWENLMKPLQVVGRRVAPAWDERDWRALSADEQREAYEALLDEERRRGFDLFRAPLMRLALVRRGEDSFYFVWSHHHILLDGWSIFLVLKEVFAVYDALNDGHDATLPPAGPFRDYIAWLQGRDMTRAEAFWRARLQGVDAPTPLGAGPRAGEERYGNEREHVGRDVTAALRALARRERLTLNALMLGAWALLLAALASRRDVLFGSTVSGRPPELAHVETTVGLFINVLPMRVRVAPERALADWLREIQETQAEMREYEYTPLVQAQRWSGVARGARLFDSILSFENYPVDERIGEQARSLEVEDFRFVSRNNYPLTLMVGPGEELRLQLVYDARRFDAGEARRLLARFQTLLGAFADRPEARLRELEDLLAGAEAERGPAEQKQRAAEGLKRFKSVKPKTVKLPEGELVRRGRLETGGGSPPVFTPALEGVELADWARANRETVERELLRHGAVLFRGFTSNAVGEFESVMQAVCPSLFGDYGDLPREGVSGKIYGSTPYPSDKAILFHNESSHTHRWPMRIAFFCVTAAERGGETPVADCRRVYDALDPRLRERFERKRLMYVRNYIESLDVSWQSFFRTTDRRAVEQFCREAGTEFEWRGETGLRTRQVCRAVAAHPRTGETVFFNQLQLHHVSRLDAAVRESLLATFGDDGLPRNVYYGDGTPIEDSVMDEVGEAYERAAVSFAWREGDILLLDNMLTAHARRPYAGARKIVVAMGEMCTEADLEAADGRRLAAAGEAK